MSADPTPSTTGNFFAVERRCWAAVAALGMNEAVSYLVLARFSQRDNRVTHASVNAIEKNTGIARGRAKQALENLQKHELIALTSMRGKLPQFSFTTAEGLASVKSALPPKPNKYKNKSEEDYAKKILKWEHECQMLAAQDWIWLPNSIIDGAGREIPPVEKLRQAGDVMTLKLLIDLYHAQNLREDGGINSYIYHQGYTREILAERAQFVIWGFAPEQAYVRKLPPLSDHYHPLTQQDQQEGKNGATQLFARLGRLHAVGLLEWVPYLFESDSQQAEMIHPLKIGNSNDPESMIGNAAYDAVAAILPEWKFDQVLEQGMAVAPSPKTYPFS